MKFLHAGAQPGIVLDNYDFSGKDTVSFIDIGGSHGEVSIALAEKYPQLSCTVQDFPSVVEHASARLPKHLQSRVKYMAHDFWAEQPIKGADIYYFRWIFHDWSDPYSVKLLQQLIPALKPGARVIINDACMPPPGVLTLEQEMGLR
jgi:trans-aconitate methyltransferase